MNPQSFIAYMATAATALRDRKDEVNKLNVFPVPDGDTGTNMSLTIDTMVGELNALSVGATLDDVRNAITHGSLMGARGNSGVITSQILRGLCEGLEGADEFDTATIAKALKRSVDVAFQAVRKPVEGTMLTVIKDTADAAKKCAKARMERDETLKAISKAAFESVQNTPNLLPVLKENNVVDAGGFGLAILLEAFVACATGSEPVVPEAFTLSGSAPQVAIELNDDWDENSEFMYCTEFLFTSPDIDEGEVREYLATIGDCDLFVGASPQYKVHVHTNNPGDVLNYMTSRGQVSEVHIHNMKLQASEREAQIAADKLNEPKKEVGFVAVAVGEGLVNILESLGVDVVVSGGQTMNPSTRDIVDAISRVHAENVIVLPNNKNIIMAANAAAEISEVATYIVPTTSVPQAFSALFAVDVDATVEEMVEAMTEAIEEVHVGEVTMAIKDSKSRNGEAIADGDIIGIADHEIEVVGKSVNDVALKLISSLLVDDGETLTILAGKDLSDEELESFSGMVKAEYPDLEVDTHRGEQPLYPLVLAVE